jgi:L-cysteine desulfidase
LKGIEAAALAGIIGGDADRQLEVLTTVSDNDREEMRRWMKSGCVHIKILDSEHPLQIIVNLKAGNDTVSVEIIDSHTGLGNVVKNGKTLHEREMLMKKQAELDYNLLNIKDSLEYADTANLHDIKDVLQSQIEKNYSIAQEGLKNEWGAAVEIRVLRHLCP